MVFSVGWSADGGWICADGHLRKPPFQASSHKTGGDKPPSMYCCNQSRRSRWLIRWMRMVAMRFDMCHPLFARALRYMRMSMASMAVHICHSTAFFAVPTNDLMRRCCLMSLKKLSIRQRAL